MTQTNTPLPLELLPLNHALTSWEKGLSKSEEKDEGCIKDEEIHEGEVTKADGAALARTSSGPTLVAGQRST